MAETVKKLRITLLKSAIGYSVTHKKHGASPWLSQAAPDG